jgi:hypothetical protein
MHRCLLMGLVSLALGLALPSEAQSCTLIGCGATFSLKAPLRVPFSRVRESTITVCLNQGCYTGSFATLAEPEAPSSGRVVSFPKPEERDATHTPLIEAIVWSDERGGYRLDVFYIPWAPNVKDGDEYTVTVVDKQGRKLVDVREKVSYKVSQPNGPRCGPTCRHASVDKT